MPGRALIITGAMMWLLTALALTISWALIGWDGVVVMDYGAGEMLAGLNIAGLVLVFHGFRDLRRPKGLGGSSMSESKRTQI